MPIKSKLTQGFNRERLFLIAACCIVAIGAALRFYSIGWEFLERDEAQTLGFLTERNIFRLIEAITTDSNPPLIHLVFWPLVQLFGSNILPEKFVAWTIASSLPAVSIFLLKNLYGRYVALYAGCLIAISPVLIRYGEMIRCYGLEHLIVVWTSVLLIWHFRGRQKLLAKYGVAICAAMYLHLSFFSVAIGQACFALSQVLVSKESKNLFIDWVKTCSIAAVFFIPWTIVVNWQLHHQLIPWLEKKSLLATAVMAMQFSLYFSTDLFYAAGTVIFLTGIAFGIKKHANGRASSIHWSIIYLGSLISIIILFQIGFPVRGRYCSTLAPLPLILFALVSNQILSTKSNDKSLSKSRIVFFILLAFLPMGILFTNWLTPLKVLLTMPESQFGRAAMDIKESINTKADMVVVGFEPAAPEVCRILPEELQIVTFPDVMRVRAVQWEGIGERILEDTRMENLKAMMQACLDRGGKVFFISTRALNEQEYAPTPKKITYVISERKRSEQIEEWLVELADEGRRKIYKARESDALAIEFSPRRR